jgi:hypothetical protein
MKLHSSNNEHVCYNKKTDKYEMADVVQRTHASQAIAQRRCDVLNGAADQNG